MKKLCALLLTAGILASNLMVVQAASGTSTEQLEQIADSIAKFETEITFKSENAGQTLLEVFQLHPELYFYFGGFEGSTRGKTVDLEMKYVNTDVDTVYVVDGADALYNAMGQALYNTDEEVAMVFTDTSLTVDHIIDTIDQWHSDNYLVYMGYSEAQATFYTSEDGSDFSSMTSCLVNISYLTDSATLQQWRQATEDKVVELSGSLFALDMPDYTKELAIHDYLVENCSYEETAAQDAEYLAYGALVEGKAVCEGYAEAANLLFQAAGLESYYVEGAGTSGDHAWNAVQIQGEWYWVDVTWDDPVVVSEDGSEADSTGSDTISHDYFNLNDESLRQDHSWQPTKYPTCTATTWDYDAVAEAVEADTATYTNFSAENITTLATVGETLATALGAVTETPTTTETPAEETATTETQSAGETESSGGIGRVLRTVLIVLLVLALLVGAYLVYRRIMYLRMLERKRAKAAARRRAQARQQGYTGERSAPRSGTSTRSSARSTSDRSRRDNPFR